MEYGVKWRGVGREKYKVWQWQRIYIPEIRKQNPSPLRTGEWIWKVSTNTALLAAQQCYIMRNIIKWQICPPKSKAETIFCELMQDKQ